MTTEQPEHTQGERQLFESLGSEVFERATSAGWLDADDPDYEPGKPEREALDLLVRLGLLRLDERTRRYYPVDPLSVQAQIVVPLTQQGSELLSESARWSSAFAEAAHVFRSSPHATVSPITEIHGIDKINAFINAALGDCREELLTAQPHRKRLARAQDRDVHALERGVRMRTLYQHSARHSPATREYVAMIVPMGADVRTLDEFFRRLIVFDRQLALIPATEDQRVAIAIHDQSLVSYLVDIFDRAWERGMPFTLTGKQAEHRIASDVRRMTLRLLAEGHSDAASAKRLGVSTRTYAGYIAALKEEYGVQTRFQLGWAMSQAESRLLEDPDASVPADRDHVSF
jgi:sugar-specific transcriptional regulator TrmB